MIRAIYTCVFLICCAFGFSQKTGYVKMSVVDYQNAKTVKDLIKDMPSDCKIVACEVSVIANGTFASVIVNDEMIKWNRAEAKKGDKIIFDGIKSTCPKKVKTKYKFILE